MKYQITGFCPDMIVECDEDTAFELLKNAIVEALQKDLDDDSQEARIVEIAGEILEDVLQADSIADLQQFFDIYPVD